MSKLATRLDRIEKNPQAVSAQRIDLALAGKLDVRQLTDAELQTIVDQTPAELQAVLARLTDEQIHAISTMQLEDLPADLRTVCDEIMEIDKRYYGTA